MIYTVFDHIHALVNPFRQDILRRGPIIEFEYLTIYKISRPLYGRKLYIASRSIDSPLFKKFLKLQVQRELRLHTTLTSS